MGCYNKRIVERRSRGERKGGGYEEDGRVLGEFQKGRGTRSVECRPSSISRIVTMLFQNPSCKRHGSNSD